MEVSLLVPYAPAGPERDAAWAWNRRRLRQLLPEAEIAVGVPDVVGHPGVFSRSLALNRAAALAEGEAFVVCDADTTYEPKDFRRALKVVAAGGWTLPERYVRLDEGASARWLQAAQISNPPPDWEHHIEQEYPFANSGVVAMPRAAFETVGGFDQRFKGWGGEDDAMRAALETLWAPPTRVGIAYHLWHPRPVEHSTGGPYNAESRALADRYGAVSGDREAMLALIAERG